LIFLNIGNYFYKKDTGYPWLICAVHYGVFAVVFIVLGCVGLIDSPTKKKKLEEEEEDEEEDELPGSLRMSLKESLTVLTKDKVEKLEDR